MAFNEQQLQCFARFEAAMRQNMTQQMATQVEAVQQAPELAACWSTVLFTLDTLAPQTLKDVVPSKEPVITVFFSLRVPGRVLSGFL